MDYIAKREKLFSWSRVLTSQLQSIVDRFSILKSVKIEKLQCGSLISNLSDLFTDFSMESRSTIDWHCWGCGGWGDAWSRKSYFTPWKCFFLNRVSHMEKGLCNGDFWFSWKVVVMWWFGERNWLKVAILKFPEVASKVAILIPKIGYV